MIDTYEAARLSVDLKDLEDAIRHMAARGEIIEAARCAMRMNHGYIPTRGGTDVAWRPITWASKGGGDSVRIVAMYAGDQNGEVSLLLEVAPDYLNRVHVPMTLLLDEYEIEKRDGR